MILAIFPSFLAQSITNGSIPICLRLQLHGAIYGPDSFVVMLRFCANSDKVHVPIFGGLSGSEDKGGGDNSI